MLSRLAITNHVKLPVCRCQGSSYAMTTISLYDDDDKYTAIQQTEARFPFKRNRLRCVSCVNENCKKRKRLRWQAANHGCHCFDRAFLLAGACVCCAKATHATQAIEVEWKRGLTVNLLTGFRFLFVGRFFLQTQTHLHFFFFNVITRRVFFG